MLKVKFIAAVINSNAIYIGGFVYSKSLFCNIFTVSLGLLVIMVLFTVCLPEGILHKKKMLIIIVNLTYFNLYAQLFTFLFTLKKKFK